MSTDQMFQQADHQPFGDPAFEPDSTFMFEGGDDDEFRNMQRNISSLNVFQNGDSMNAGAFDPSQSNFVTPMFFDQSQMSPDSPTFAQSPTTFQGDVFGDRCSSVVHRFGQITPPDDLTPKGFPSVHPSKTQATAPQPDSAVSAKSERARNAANQRHAKAKKARKDSANQPQSPVADVSEEADDKREKYREKNRLAAAKCRAKKKTNTEDLEESARIATATNTKLRAEERELRDLFSSLRHAALAHDPSQGCNCTAIHMYNGNKAQEAAKGAAMGLQNLAAAAASPSLGSDGSAAPSPGGASSRAQSSSASRPTLAMHHPRSQSLASSFSFVPQKTSRMQSPVVMAPTAEDLDEDQAMLGYEPFGMN